MNDQGDDDSLEDDLMDKISSSPSIDDGNYPLPVMWPPRRDSVDSGVTHSPFSTPTRGNDNSSSPFTSTPEYFPWSLCKSKNSHPKSHQGGYGIPEERNSTDSMQETGNTTLERLPQTLVRHQEISDDYEDYDADLDEQDVGNFLLPVDDPLLDNGFDDTDDDLLYEDEDESGWEDDDETAFVKDDSSSDDDTGTFQFTDNPRFIDSGWGGECLREVEDIDFEFVYALHTFVATVEGQANATKGDTMVLLDDSNSYWWLVRVVKDGSIGNHSLCRL